MSAHRPIFLVIGTVAANLIFLVLCPNFIVPPRLSEQIGNALVALGLSLIPFAWGFYLLFAYRNLKERILAYLAIAVSLLWVGISTNLLIQVMKERSIYHLRLTIGLTNHIIAAARLTGFPAEDLFLESGHD